MKRHSLSPYRNPDRLPDVVAALQAFGAHQWFEHIPEKWQHYLGDKPPISAATWNDVFAEHPEFFRFDDEGNVSLVIRRSLPRRYHVEKYELIPAAALSDQDRAKLSRRPLNPSEIATLVRVAPDLHKDAREEEQNRRWWVSAAVAVAASLLSLGGVLVGAWIRSGA